MNTFIIGLFLAYASADSICGNDQRFMTALTCNDNTTFLHCAPNNLRNRAQFCNNPNLKWSEAKCKNYGGYNSLDVVNTGCYSSSTLLSMYNVTNTCDTPIKVYNKPLDNLDFELGNLNGWTVSGPSLPVVVCDGNTPNGNCYAQLSTENTGRGRQPNKIERNDLVITNGGGCNGGDKKLTFWYKFQAGDYLPFNDKLTVNVNNGTLFTYVLDVATVGDFGNSGWKQVVVELGAVPMGTLLSVSISAEITNGLDTNVNSYGYIDDVKLEDSVTLALPLSLPQNNSAYKSSLLLFIPLIFMTLLI
jgi:hypothetical protein